MSAKTLAAPQATQDQIDRMNALKLPLEYPALLSELGAMVEEDPFRATKFEKACFGRDRPRTEEIGRRLNELGGMDLMVKSKL